MTFLEALHASRQRQAAREIDRHRHLIDEASAIKMRRAIARAHAKASPPARAAHRPEWPLAILFNRIRMWAHAG
jgi:hypothetical protein